MAISAYIQNLLSEDVYYYLVRNHQSGTYPHVQDLYRQNRNGPFFYEGTVRAQIAHFIQNALPHHQEHHESWIVISEQPYPAAPNQRADVLIRDLDANHPYTIVIEVKADLNIESAIDDLYKLAEVLAHPDQRYPINEGYVFSVCPPLTMLNDWLTQIGNRLPQKPPTLHVLGISAGG